MDMDADMLSQLDVQFGYKKPEPKPRPIVTKKKAKERGFKYNQFGTKIVFEPSHPLAIQTGRDKGWVLEHRKIAYDAGLMSDPNQQVRHINKVIDDNRLENLEVWGTAPRCPNCGGSNRTGGDMCGKCSAVSARRRSFTLRDEPTSVDDELKRDLNNICFGIVASYLQPYFRSSLGKVVQKRESKARRKALQEVADLAVACKDLAALRTEIEKMLGS